jgi:hypothetical protein
MRKSLPLLLSCSLGQQRREQDSIHWEGRQESYHMTALELYAGSTVLILNNRTKSKALTPKPELTGGTSRLALEL